MLKKSIKALSIPILIVATDLVFYLLQPHLKESKAYGFAYFAIMTLLIFLLSMSLLYKRAFTLKSHVLVSASIVFASLFLSQFVAGRLRDAGMAYERTAATVPNKDERLIRLDEKLMYRSNPNQSGFHYYNIGDSIFGKIPVFTDSFGFRTVADSNRVASDTTDLFLGCSMTFGSFIKAEEGFPYLTTKALNHSLHNAALPGYGMGQMMELLDTMLAVKKYKYVFLQMSDWLSTRAGNLTGPIRGGYPPIRYFSENKDGTYTLNNRAYRQNLEKPSRPWYTMGRSYRNRLLYLSTDGLNQDMIGYTKLKLARIKVALGLIPAPASDKVDLETWFYRTSIEKIRKSGAIPVIYRMWDEDNHFDKVVANLDKDVVVIDLDAPLDSMAKVTGKTKQELFRIYHVHNGQRLYYDNHPNALASELMSKQMIGRLKPE